MSNITQFPRIIILLMLFTFATFVGILFTPALPQIGKDFGISATQAQWTMSIFLVGYCLGQLPYGPVANRFGRKKAISVGVVLALIGSIMAYSATAFWVLCLARFIQAIGSGAGLKIGFTMVGDLHQGAAATRAVSILSLGFGIMPGLAATIGGYITVLGGWHGCFLFLSLYSVVLWLLCRFLPETAHELHKDALQLNKIGRGLSFQLKDPFVTLHAILAGLSTSIVYIFVTLSPYIAIQRIGLAPNEFGLWSFVPSLGLLSGVLVSRSLSKRSNPRLNMLSGILIVLIGALILSICFANALINVWTLFLPAYLLNLGNNLIWTHASAKGLSETHDKSNTSAVIQFINVGCAALSVFLIEIVPPTTTMLLPAALGIVLLLMFAVWLKLKPHHS